VWLRTTDSKSTPSRKAELEAELAKIKAAQASLMQQIQNRHAEGRPGDEPAEEFSGEDREAEGAVQCQTMAIGIRKLIFLARNNADGLAKRRLMPIVRDLIQTVVSGITPGHQPASLHVHGDIAHVMASMHVIDVLQHQFTTSAQNDPTARMVSTEIHTEHKKNNLIKANIKELSSCSRMLFGFDVHVAGA